MNLVLVGYRGTGKSVIAQRLGALLGRQVVSLDRTIAERASMSIPEIVAAHGWDYFRNLEVEVCREVAATPDLVIDCGGGVVEREANITALRASGTVFWLRATPATIVTRIGGDSNRPSLTGNKSFTEEVEEVLVRRWPLYERLAHHALDTDARTPDDLADAIARRFRASAT